VKILVNVVVYPAILPCSRSQIVENIADQRENDTIAIILKAPETINIPQSYREYAYKTWEGSHSQKLFDSL